MQDCSGIEVQGAGVAQTANRAMTWIAQEALRLVLLGLRGPATALVTLHADGISSGVWVSRCMGWVLSPDLGTVEFNLDTASAHEFRNLLRLVYPVPELSTSRTQSTKDTA